MIHGLLIRAMRSGGSKQKGANFERETCKRLSLWLSKGTREDLFWRSAMSGGRATLQLQKGIINQTQAGDISAIDVAGAILCDSYLIECKFYKDLELSQSILLGRGNLVAFWRVAKKAADACSKRPMLIAKQNRFPTLVVLPAEAILFETLPLLTVRSWAAEVYLFEEATQYRQRLRL